MPAYRAAGVDVRLSVSPIDLTKQDHLQNGGTHLSEEYLPFLEEESGIHFLDGCSKMPFLFVKACGIKEDVKESLLEKLMPKKSAPAPPGYSLRNVESRVKRLKLNSSNNLDDDTIMTDPDAPEVSTRSKLHHSISSTSHLDVTPTLKEADASAYMTLLLTISLEQKLSFSRSLQFERRKDMKIDVYLNGSLIHCHFISARSKCQDSTYVVQIAGLRSGRRTEKAMLLKISSKGDPKDEININSRATRRGSKTLKPSEERWKSISEALLERANQYGIKDGNRPPGAKYLACLAGSPIPEDLLNSSENTNAEFAVIDCVLTLGSGTKYPTSCGYLQRPEIMKDMSFAGDEMSQMEMPLPTPTLRPAKIRDTGAKKSRAPSHNDAGSDVAMVYPKRSPRLALTQKGEPIAKQEDTAVVATPRPSRTRSNSSGLKVSVGRDSLGGSQQKLFLPTSNAPTPNSTSSSVLERTTPTVVAGKKDNRRTAVRKKRQTIDAAQDVPAEAPAATPQVATPQDCTPVEDSAQASSRAPSFAGKSRIRRSSQRSTLVEPGWTTPELSVRSVVTFMEGEGEGDGIRFIRSERTGEFVEDEVLVGVRYLLDANTVTH